MHVHMCTGTCIHVQAHVQTHVHVQAQALCTCVQQVCTRTSTRACAPMTHVFAHTYADNVRCTHTTRTHTCIRTHSCMRSGIPTCMRMHGIPGASSRPIHSTRSRTQHTQPRLLHCLHERERASLPCQKLCASGTTRSFPVMCQ